MKQAIREHEFDARSRKAPGSALRSADERIRQRWLAENHGAIDAYNREVERYGCFGDSLRRF
ncbi:MAG: type II toxin-antitoxin system CcdA family antitoxin [Burkholderiaceae bacterium]|nr:type II toxin-antitoxin system CcdA family antitoxin [Burkholderiaceae bacterium]